MAGRVPRVDGPPAAEATGDAVATAAGVVAGIPLVADGVTVEDAPPQATSTPTANAERMADGRRRNTAREYVKGYPERSSVTDSSSGDSTQPRDEATAPVRRALAAFALRDLDAMARELTDDVIWITPGRSLIAGEFRGWPDVRRYLERALELTADSVQVELVDVLTGLDHVAVVVDVRGRRGGRVLDQRCVQLFRLRDGQIAQRRIYPLDQTGWDAFWS